jgi:hypothetical protein
MKLFTGLALGGLTLSLASCYAGPHQLRRSVDDWDQKMYVESPWIDAVLWVIPVIPLVSFGAQIADFFVVDAYYFWAKDAWDGNGTAYRHLQPEPTDGTMESLLFDDAKFFEVK